MASGSNDIPGYYYDEEKRRYFKLPPSHFSQLSTYKDIVQTKHTPPTETLPRQPPLSLYNLTQSRGPILNQEGYARSCYLCIPGSLYTENVIDLPPEVLSDDSSLEFDHIKITETGDIMFLRCSNKKHSKGYLVYGIINDADECPSVDWVNSERLNFDHENDYCILQTDSNKREVRGMEYSPCPHRRRSEPFSNTIYHTAIGLDWENSFCRINRRRCALSESPFSAIKINPDHYTHNHGGAEFALGCEDGSIVVYLEWKYVKLDVQCHQSTVFSLAFAEEGNLLFAGYRNGSINALDLRRSPERVVNIKEPKEANVASSVIALHPLKNNNYLISSAFNSKVSLWDVRMCKKVLQYKGHTNNYARCCKSIVDDRENYFAAVGSDYCVRMWSLGNGQLLHCIPPEDYGCADTLPAICYTDTFGGKQFNPTLIVSSVDRLVSYSL